MNNFCTLSCLLAIQAGIGTICIHPTHVDVAASHHAELAHEQDHDQTKLGPIQCCIDVPEYSVFGLSTRRASDDIAYPRSVPWLYKLREHFRFDFAERFSLDLLHIMALLLDKHSSLMSTIVIRQ